MRAVVGHGQRVGIEHHALEARVGTHVLAHLLAHETGIAPGGEGVEQHPEGFPRAETGTERFCRQGLDRGEITDEGEARPQRDREPHDVLQPALFQFVGVPGRLVELPARDMVAFQPVFHPHEDFGVHGLRAGVAAPQAAGHRGEQEQRQRGKNQQAGQVDEILRPEHQAENIEFACGQIEQHRLAVVPMQPGHTVIERLGQQHQRDAPIGEHAVHRARLDFLPDRVELLLGRGVGGGGLLVVCHCVYPWNV